MGKKSKHNGAQLFEEFYSELYGERWPKLREALLAPKEHTVLVNPYSDFDSHKLKPFHNYPHLFKVKEEIKKVDPDKDEKLPLYFLDGASALAPLSLDIEEGDRVLDLCAAPGGKSLILAYALNQTGTLTANDKSENRRFRLLSVLRRSLPDQFFASSVRVTGFDTSAWCLHETQAYNKILLDAPCSSERHVLESPEHLKEWRIGRTKRLSKLQWSMLASSWLVLEYGGRLVYSTCSLSPYENDQVVAKLLKKFKDEVEIIEPNFPFGERTEHGTIILPDESGMGPFYLSIFKKVKRN